MYSVSQEEGVALFDATARRVLGVSGKEFLACWDRGGFDGVDRSLVEKVEMLIPFVR